MSKYPWDQDKEIDWSADPVQIAKQYAHRYHDSTDKLIDYYFAAKALKMLCIAGWSIAAILFFCLVVVSQ
jgi:hypothetical protein